MASFGLADRLRFHAPDLFADRLPSADVLVMGMILQDWDLEQKRTLIAKGVFRHSGEWCADHL